MSTPYPTPPNTLMAALDIEITDCSKEQVVAHMPVGPKVLRPFGLLHGGASVALAETVASLGGYMNVDQEKEGAVGLEINANHLRAIRPGGVITATAKPVHIGRRTHVREVRIVDEQGRLVCISRCTLAVVPKAAS